MKYNIILIIGIIIIICILIKKPIENFTSGAISQGTELQTNVITAASKVSKGETIDPNSPLGINSLERAAVANIGSTYTNNLVSIMPPLKNSSYNADNQKSVSNANAVIANILTVPKFKNIKESFENNGGIKKQILQTPPAENTLPVTANINRCELVTDTECSNFNKSTFANCGICFEPGQTSDKSALPRIGGLYFSSDDMASLQNILNNPDKSNSEKKTALNNAKPTIGSCPTGKFAVNTNKCKRLQNEAACRKGQSFNVPGCSQCVDDNKFYYTDIEDAGLLVPRLMLIGSGTLIVNGNTIELSSTPQQINLTNNNEGDIIFLDVTGDNAYIAGYIAGDTEKGEYRQDIFRLIDVDRISGSKPKLSGKITVGDEICMKIVTAKKGNNRIFGVIQQQNNKMQLQLNLVYSFLGTDTGESTMCKSSPYITEESSAIFLASGSCYKPGNGPGSYSAECLQEIWGDAGCTNSGSGYPTNAMNVGKLNELGKIQNISEYIYDLSLKTTTGRNRSGTKLNLKDMSDAALKCTGQVIQNACDLIPPGEPITPECMSFLYSNGGVGENIGGTYSGTPDQMTKNPDGKLVYCTNAGLINPLNNGTTEFSSNSGKVLFSELPSAATNFGRFEIKKNYRITCIVRPTGVVSNWGSLYHFTRNGSDANSVGERMPAVWFYPGSTQLHVRIGDSSNLNWGYDPHISLPLNQDTLLQITAIGDNITISIGSAEFKFRQQTPGGRPSGLAYLYAPDPWYSRMQGSVRNLTLTTSDGNLPGSVASYAVTPRMSINEIKSKYNAAFNDMINGDPNGLAACRGIAVAQYTPTYSSTGNWENRVEGTRVNIE